MCLGIVLTFWRSLRSLYALNPHTLPPTVLLNAAMASTASSMIGIVRCVIVGRVAVVGVEGLSVRWGRVDGRRRRRGWQQ